MNNYYGVRVTAHCRPRIHREHNNRTLSVVGAEQHIDLTKMHEVILDMGDMYECYEKIFGDAVANYNMNQKRKDRRIENYLETILNDKRKGKLKNIKSDNSRKQAYEFIFKLGNRDNQIDPEVACNVLKKFVTEFMPKKYPNIVPIGIYLHDDEFSIDSATGEQVFSPPHIHFDFVPVAHRLTDAEIQEEKERREKIKNEGLKKKKLGEKQKKVFGALYKEDEEKGDLQEDMVKRYGKALMSGIELQSSLSASLLEMGFKTQKKKGTAQMQFQESVRFDLQDFAESLGVLIDRTPGPKHSYMEKDQYQLKRENERKENILKEKAMSLIKKEKGINIAGKKLNKEAEEIKRNKKDIERMTTFHKNLKEINKNVQNHISAIDDLEKDFYKKKEEPLKSRVTSFSQKAKYLIAAVVYELGQYKKAFTKFWNYGAKEFRILAKKLEKNGCRSYREYVLKEEKGQLKKQKLQKENIGRRYKR